MNVKRLRTLCIEIFKTLNNLNLNFMKEIFSLRQTNRPVRQKYKLNLDILSYNQVTFGCKALTFFDPKSWNSLPYHIKSAESLPSFKIVIKFWNGETCGCQICCKFFFSRLEIQRYQMTHAFVDPEVKLVTRVTTKLLRKSCLISESNLLNISSKTVYKKLLFNISSNSI